MNFGGKDPVKQEKGFVLDCQKEPPVLSFVLFVNLKYGG
jgi:hypothetical protein